MLPKGFSCAGEDDNGDFQPDFDGGNSDHEAVAESEPDADVWERVDDKVIRHHNVPRQQLFSPMAADGIPCGFNEILPFRANFKISQNGRTKVKDEWTSPQPAPCSEPFWTGRTEIACKLSEQEAGDVDLDFDHQADQDGEDGLRTPAGDGPATPASSGGLRTPGADDKALKRKRARTNQLQRGFWLPDELQPLMQHTVEFLQNQGGQDWQFIPLQEELAQRWVRLESANAEVCLLLASLKGRKLRKPQPHYSPLEVPLRKSFLLLQCDKSLTTSWKSGISFPHLPVEAFGGRRQTALYGKAAPDEDVAEEEDARRDTKEVASETKWNSLPGELKLALRRVHVNLGHETTARMLGAMRLSRASVVAIRARRLFRCPDCPRIQQPKKPGPSKLLLTEESMWRLVWTCCMKRMPMVIHVAIEGALLRETVRQTHAFSRWIDGMQNISNVVTKANAEKDSLRESLRSGMTSLVQIGWA